jgi:hypothetical protein
VIIEKINLAESNLANKIFVAFSFMSCVDRRTVFTVLSLRRTFLQLFIKAGAGPWEQGCLEALLQSLFLSSHSSGLNKILLFSSIPKFYLFNSGGCS